MYSWIVKKALLRHLYDKMKTLFYVCLFVAFFVTLVPTFQHAFGGRPNVTCWLSELSMTNVSVVLNKVGR